MTYERPHDTRNAVRLHLNENTAGCSPAVLAAIRSIAREDTAYYPDYGPVTAEAERYFGVPAGWVQLTNGLDEGILLASIAYLGNRTPTALVELGAPLTAPSGTAEIVVARPAFDPYLHAAQSMGARIVAVPPGPVASRGKRDEMSQLIHDYSRQTCGLRMRSAGAGRSSGHAITVRRCRWSCRVRGRRECVRHRGRRPRSGCSRVRLFRLRA